MPELPEVETVRRTLKNMIIGSKITHVTTKYPPIIAGDAGLFADSVSRQRFCDIDRVGKYLIFILDDGAFISHLRMEGKYVIAPAGGQFNKHEHLSFHLDDGRELRYHDTRKFGRMELTDKTNYRQLPPLNKLGPEPFEAEPNILHERLKRSRLPIKSLLLNQSILAGIGNIYANEICHRARLDPRMGGSALSVDDTARLLAAACEILNDAITEGGSSIHSFSSAGISGRFQLKLKIHGQENCGNCHGAVTKISVGGRGTYFCAKCLGKEPPHAQKRQAKNETTLPGADTGRKNRR